MKGWKILLLLEICVDSLASARAAIAGGADRLELCSALLAGGLTPYAALLQQIRAESDIAIRCLMRPRAGDFLYTAEEIDMMATQIRQLKALGANGFVIGCLTAYGHLDAAAMKPLIDAADGAGLTLHRAIDVSQSPIETYLQAKELGIDTVLTSGAAANCLLGEKVISQLLQLQEEANGPQVLIGAGVKAAVITHFRQNHPSAKAFHMSGTADIPSAMRFRREGVPMGLPGLDEWHIQQTDEAAVRAAKAALAE